MTDLIERIADAYMAQGWFASDDRQSAVELAAGVRWVAEPIIRADERERIVAELEGPARESEAMYAHAEAVAAKLVEVICEDAARIARGGTP